MPGFPAIFTPLPEHASPVSGAFRSAGGAVSPLSRIRQIDVTSPPSGSPTPGLSSGAASDPFDAFEGLPSIIPGTLKPREPSIGSDPTFVHAYREEVLSTAAAPPSLDQLPMHNDEQAHDSPSAAAPLSPPLTQRERLERVQLVSMGVATYHATRLASQPTAQEQTSERQASVLSSLQTSLADLSAAEPNTPSKSRRWCCCLCLFFSRKSASEDTVTQETHLARPRRAFMG